MKSRWLVHLRSFLCLLCFLGFVSFLRAAPTNTVPGAVDAVEDTNFTFNAANSALISVADPSLGGTQNLEVSITLTGLGDLQLSAATAQLVFDGKISFSTGSADVWLKAYAFQGTIADLNSVLDGMVFKPMADNAHVDTLSITTTEPTSKQTDTDSFSITVAAVNDAPILTAPVSGGSVEEGGKVTFSSADEAMQILVVDDATTEQDIQAQIAVANGTATLSGLANVNITAGGNGTAAMTFKATTSEINVALDGLVFRPAIGFSGNATLDLTLDDLGNNGSGGALTATAQIGVAVTSANSAPVITVPAPQAIAQDTALTFSSANSTQVTVDDDATEDNSSILMTLAVGSGTLKLASTTGITFQTGADNTASMALLGEVGNLQLALAGLVYTPQAGFLGTDTLSIDVDDQGNTGPGGVKTASESVSIVVSSTTPAPENTAPNSVSATEDTAITFSSASNSVSVSDADTTVLQIRLQVSTGSLTLAGTANLTFATGDGTQDGDMIFSGAVADLNTALDGLVFEPEADSTSATITITTSEQGGGVQSDTDTISVSFSAVNDAPVITFPGAAQLAPTNSAFEFSQAKGNVITIKDDATEDAGFVEMELTATNGVVNLKDDSALIPFTGSNNSAAFSYVGEVGDFNTAFDGMTFTPTTDYLGAAQITIRVNDQGAYGSGGTKETTETLSFTVVEAGNAPVNTLPATATVDEDAALTFSSVNGNALSVADSDSAQLSLDLKVSMGGLTLGGTTGLTFTTGDGTADTAMVFSGTLANLNTALEGLVFQPESDTNGSVTLTLTSTETEAPQLSDIDTLTITVNAVNDAPVLAVPPSQSIAEDGTLTFSTANANVFTLTDDASDSSTAIEVQLTVSNGTVKLAQTTGLTVTTGADASATVTFQGQLSSALAALEGLAFTPRADFSGADQLQIRVNDQGGTGTGGAQEVNGTVAITVAEGNDAPMNTVPVDQALAEDATLTFSSANANAVSVSDSEEDGASGSLTVSLQVDGGTLSLSGTAGLTFTAGDGATDAAMTFQGAPDSLNSALAGMTYQPVSDFSGEITVTMSTTDAGDVGTGANPLADTDTFKITIAAVNDGPTLSVPAAQSIAEEGTLTFNTANANAFSLTDDASDSATAIEVQLTVSNGTVKLAQTTGLTVTAGADASATVTFQAQLSSALAALEGLAYSPTADYSGADQLQIRVNDQGGTGTGGAQEVNGTVAITVSGANDAPVNTVPADQALAEDATLAFFSANSIALSVSDPDEDSASGSLMVSLQASGGTLSLSVTTGLIFSTGDGMTDASMTFQGTPERINVAMEGMIYQPEADFSGEVTLTMSTTDGGDAGTGANPLTDTDTFKITITAANDAPTLTVPATQGVAEEGTLTFSTAVGNAFAITDDASDSATAIEVQLTVSNGTVKLAQTTGLTVTAGADASATVTFQAQLSSVLAALEGLAYTPTTDYSGVDQLQIRVNDQGGTGAGGAKEVSGTVPITVAVGNDAPVNTVPADQAMAEGATLTFSSGNGNAVSVSDSEEDGASGSLNVSLEVDGGTLSFSGTAGLTFSVGDGTADASMTFQGMPDNLNSALAGMTYQPVSDFSGEIRVTMSTTDGGDVGTGANPLTDTDTFKITITAVNDPPVVSAPAAQAMAQDDSLTFSAAVGNTFGLTEDASDSATAIEVQLTVSNGTVTLAQTTGLTVTAGADESLTITFDGQVDAVVAALDGLVYTPDADFSGTDQLQLRVNDKGGTGTGGAQEVTASVTITVIEKNEPPVNALPAGQTLSEDTSLTFSSANGNSLTVSDSHEDAASGSLTTSLQVSAGTLSLSGTAGLAFTAGDGTEDTSMTFQGTPDSLNVALAGMTYQPDADFSGEVTLTIGTTDSGDVGTGVSPLRDTDTLSVSVTAVNDPPTLTVPAAQILAEEGTLTFSTANAFGITDDASDSSASIEVQLTVSSGTVKLSQTTGLTVTSGADSTATVTFQGQVSAALAAMEGLAYMPPAGFSGSDQLQVRINDQGSTGAGEAKEVTATVDITVTPTNDPPVSTVPAGQTFSEDTPLIFSSASSNSLSVSDTEEVAASGNLAVAIQVTDGVLTLSGTAGLTFTSGDGTADASMAFNGTPDSLNAAMEGASFTPDVGYSGEVTLTLATTDGGDIGTGANPLTDTDTVLLTVQAVNDAPNLTVPGAQSVLEDAVLIFAEVNSNAFGLTDDASETNTEIEVQLTVSSGVLTLGRTHGLTFSEGADGASTFTILAGVGDVAAAFEGLSYAPDFNFSGTDNLVLRVNDRGATGFGGAQEATASIEITVVPLNDAPINTVPGPQAGDEDVPLVFSAANGNAVSVDDPDEDGASGSLSISLQVSNGMLSLSGTAGLSFITGDGADDAQLAFSGSPDTINTALEGMSFKLPEDQFGTSTLTLSTTDDGDPRTSENLLTDTNAIEITVAAVNDVPVLTLPGNFNLDEDSTFSFSAQNNAAITVADDADDSSILLLKVSLTAGTLPSSVLQGVTTGTDDEGRYTLNYSSTVAGLNTFMAGLSFFHLPDANGASVLTFEVDDQGSHGSGGAQVVTRSMVLTVDPVNDAPVHALPSDAVLEEDTPLTFSTVTGNAITVEDVDAELVESTLTVGNGMLTLATTTDIIFSVGDGTGDATMTFQGSPDAINAALDGLVYQPNFNYDQDDTLSLTTSDLGNQGAGGVLKAVDSLLLDILPVDDVPRVLGAVSNQLLDDTATLQPFTSLQVLAGDGDTDDQAVRILLDDNAKGAFSADSLTESGFTLADGVYVQTAQPDVLTAGIQKLVFEPVPNRLGNGKTEGVAFTLVVQGVEFTTTDYLTTLKVTSVNDAPSLTGLQDRLEITDGVSTKPFSSVNLEDPDVGSTVTVSVLLESSALLGTWAGAESFVMSADGTLTYTGIPGTAETLLNKLEFTPYGSTERKLPPGSLSLTKLYVTASDGIAQGLSISADVQITLGNTAPSGVSLASSTVPENYKGFYAIGEVVVLDTDHGDSHSLQIIGAPTGDLFTLAAGVLYAKSPFDYETLDRYELTLRATDLVGLSVDGVVVVQVSDVRTEDADLDGLTQEEEEDIHGSSDLLADTDADGHTDTAEAFAGSDAADPWSTPLGVLGRAVALGDGWRSLDWLGTFQADNFPWLYHMGLGWIYPIEAESDDLWIWLPGVGWVWADAKVFPQMYDSRAAAWLYLDAASGDLYRYQGGEWVKL